MPGEFEVALSELVQRAHERGVWNNSAESCNHVDEARARVVALYEAAYDTGKFAGIVSADARNAAKVERLAAAIMAAHAALNEDQP